MNSLIPARAAAALLIAAAATASPITYTITGTGTGVFGGQHFTNAAYSISMTADTSNITNLGGGLFLVIAGSSRIQIPSLNAAGSFTDTVQVAANQSLSVAGFGDTDQDLAIVFVSNPGFAGYNLAPPIGPLSGVGPFNPGATFPTTFGDFELDSISAAAFTAQAMPPCYPNCDASTTPPLLNVNDFTCFLNAFAAGATYANCDHSTTAPLLNILDFTCFLNAFATGCR